jgi:hypothetical protein
MKDTLVLRRGSHDNFLANIRAVDRPFRLDPTTSLPAFQFSSVSYEMLAYRSPYSLKRKLNLSGEQLHFDFDSNLTIHTTCKIVFV